MAGLSLMSDYGDDFHPHVIHSSNVKSLPMVIKSSASPPSLQQASLVKISVSLWLEGSIRNEVAAWNKFYNPFEMRHPLFNHQEKWQEIEGKVLKNLSSLTLPHKSNETIKEIITTVGEQILNFLYHRIYTNHTIARIYLDNLCWTSFGTIDQVKTASLLFQNEGLDTLKKYELACSICSESDIHYYLEGLPENFINDYVENRKLRLMLFWTLHIKKDNDKLFEIRKREFKFQGSNERYIFEYALESKNEVAMRQIFNRFPLSGIRNSLVYLTKFALQENPFCLPFLMSCMLPVQIEGLCLRFGYLILKRFATDWRLRCYFQPTAKCVLEYISHMDFSDALQTIVLCWKEKHLDDDECKKLLREFIALVRGDNDVAYQSACNILLSALFALEDEDSIYQLLRIGNATVKAQVICSDCGLKECFNLALSGKFDLLNIFIKETLQMDEDIVKFKNTFFGSEGFKITCTFIDLSAYHTLDQFLSFFQTPEQIRIFKIELPYREKGKIISSIIKSITYIDSKQLKLIDEFLNWTYNGCAKKVSNCKGDVFHKNIGYINLQEELLAQVLNLVTLGEVELVNHYLSWAFNSTERIHKVKNQFFEKRSFDICCHMITNKQYDLLSQFLKMFCSESEIDTFKFSLPVGKQGKIIKEIMNGTTREDSIEQIITFLNYSFAEDAKLVNYIKEMVVDQGKDIDIDCRDIFLEKVSNLMKAGDWSLVDKYMRWAFSVEEERFTEIEPPPPDKKEEKETAETKRKSLRLDRLIDRDPDFNRLDRMIDPEYRLFRPESMNFSDYSRLRADRLLDRDPDQSANRLPRPERMVGRRGRVMNAFIARRGFRRHRPTQ